MKKFVIKKFTVSQGLTKCAENTVYIGYFQSSSQKNPELEESCFITDVELTHGDIIQFYNGCYVSIGIFHVRGKDKLVPRLQDTCSCLYIHQKFCKLEGGTTYAK